MCAEVTYVSVVGFIEREITRTHGVRKEKYDVDAKIATDLGIDGDDALELLQAVERQYGVELSDIHNSGFWPEAGILFSKKVKPISSHELASIVCSRLNPPEQ